MMNNQMEKSAEMPEINKDINYNIGVLIERTAALQQDMESIKKWINKNPTRDEFDRALERITASELKMLEMQRQIDMLQEKSEKSEKNRSMALKVACWILKNWLSLVLIGFVFYDVTIKHEAPSQVVAEVRAGSIS